MSLSLNTQQKIVIFTDFDGTILDHFTYSFEAAKSTMQALKEVGIPIIPNTSKTFAEVSELRKIMDLDSAFIVENGAGIYMPQSFFPEKPRGAVWQKGFWVKSFAQKRSHWVDILKRLGDYSHLYESFSNMSIERIMEVTGLDADSTKLASSRQFSEPLLWTGTDEEKDKFITLLKSLGARPLIGGRFLHVCGDNNKGKALKWLQKEYQRQYSKSLVTSIALGDGNNDIDMLEIADYALRISSPVHAPPEVKRSDKLYTSIQHGPEGWAELLQQLIPELQTRINNG